jgi:hypothetical protein
MLCPEVFSGLIGAVNMEARLMRYDLLRTVEGMDWGGIGTEA